MVYAVLFLTIAVGLGDLAISRGGAYELLVWPAISFAIVALAYIGVGPCLLGKRPDGRVRGVTLLLLLPYFLYAWGVWCLRQRLTAEPAADEATPGLWVGRRPAVGDLPADVSAIVDLAAEFPAVRRVRRLAGYRSFPTLDGMPTPAGQIVAAVRFLESTGGIAYIHCAFGHGRSAALAAAVIVHRGLASDVTAAEALMRRRRPRIRLKRSQRTAAAEAVRILRS